jgi:UDP-glucose 4-epimerase
MLEGKKIFITGGAGFIGSMLGQELSGKNKVLLFDNLHRNALQYRKIDTDNVRFVEGNVLDYKHLRGVLDEFRPTHVVHCAAIAGIDTVIKSPTKTLRVNILGTANLLQHIQELNLACERIVFFSTSEIFGQQAFQSTEEHCAVIGAVGEARWTYALSKLADEHFALAYYKEYGIPCTVARPFNVYGPGQVGEGALSIFVQRAIKNEPIFIHGDGTQIRAWCYIDDMVDGIMLLLQEDQALGECFNIGNPKSVLTTYGLAQAVCRILASESPIEFSNRHFADIELRVPNIQKAQQVLGFQPKVDLELGIRRTADFYRDQDENRILV